ncbi:MAG: 23S rRNA (uracil(1939)-C(5))-methyltransferase RlmD [Cyclobacteriaceae bacterium]|nr:23S rRNA (uracil(1939)-C(5))-methyltransferase RlmD [Cyclobacteriaceae bacterium]MDW8330051.1 23S rRNA (uracil(1939)-C(5))-methyltransferase RlmD [Cyclobacteriaceae bacterium]
MRPGEILENLQVESMAAEGRCVARHNGKVIFVERAAPGDVVRASVLRSKSNYAEAQVLEVLKPSPLRSEPFCRHFGFCGGCVWQHIKYEVQLQYKQQQVADSLQRIGGVNFPEILPIKASEQIRFYRNRLDFTATNRRWLPPDELKELDNKTAVPVEPGLGFHVPKKFDQVFDVHHCWLQAEPGNAIRLAIKEIAIRHNISFYNIRKQSGYLRTVTIRTTTTGEVMVIIQVAEDRPDWLEIILNNLIEKFPQITSLVYTINAKRNDTFHDLTMLVGYGKPFITEVMDKPDSSGKLYFQIGPKSFYQTNPKQAEVLYRTAWEMARLSGKELVYDLYTGTGTIACYVAAQAAKVVGLEYVTEAVEDARNNARINEIRNVSFFSGDIKDLLSGPFLHEHGRPDVVITDPPRAGMHEDVCRMLLLAAPQRIVYVSCNPATQARDIKILAEHYEVTAVQPVDMFPHTMHVENVVGLERRKTQ